MAQSIYARLMDLHHNSQPDEYKIIAAYIFGKYDLGADAALLILSKFDELARDPAIESTYKEEVIRTLLLGNFRGAKLIVDTIENKLREPAQLDEFPKMLKSSDRICWILDGNLNRVSTQEEFSLEDMEQDQQGRG